MLKPFERRLPWQTRLARSWFALLIAMIFIPIAGAQSASPTTSQTGAANSDAAAKAAERKKRFEEEKRRVEGQEGAQTAPCTEGKPTLYITPTTAAMLVGESRRFTVFDTDGHKLTATAEWTVSSSFQAELTPGDEPTVTAKNEGTFKVIARVDTRFAEATVKIYPGDKLPIGTIRWSVAPIPCRNGRITKVVQASPSPRQ